MGVAVYEVGQTMTFGLYTYAANGTTLADLGGGLPTATITKPDGSTAAAVVTKTGTGTYIAELAAAALGRHVCAWTGSGTNSGGLPRTDLADVLDLRRLAAPLAVVRDGLNMPASSVVDDAELLRHIAAATLTVEQIAGPVLAATKVETRSGGNRYSLALFDYPSAVTSVTVDGTAVTDWALDEAGILWRGSRPGGGVWPNGAGNVVITYTVGDPSVAPDVVQATCDLVAHWWRHGQQSYYVDGPPEEDAAPPVAGYAIPGSVYRRLARHAAAHKVPGIA
jgi:hypothetical protein